MLIAIVFLQGTISFLGIQLFWEKKSLDLTVKRYFPNVKPEDKFLLFIVYKTE